MKASRIHYWKSGILLVAVLLVSVHAEQAPSPDSVSLEGPIIYPSSGLPGDLTLTEAIRLAVANNLGAKVEKLQETIEDARIQGRKAEFHPAFSISGLYESIEKPQNTREFVATQSTLNPRTSRIFEEENQRYNTALKGKTPLGTEYEFAVEMNTLRNTLNIDRPPSLYYPEYESFAGLRLTQPLLRDFGPSVQYAGLRVAQVDRQLATLAWRLKVSQVVAAVAKNYYDLAFSAGDTVIKRQNIQRARELEDQSRKRVERGVGSLIDVQQASVAASVREEDLISAEYNQKEKANLLLRDLVADLNVEAIPRVNVSHRLTASVPSLARTGLLQQAYANRVEYLQARQQLEKQDIKITFAKNQLLPRVDLIGSLGANGLNRSGGSSLGDAFEATTPAWSIGLSVTIPLGNQQAKAQMKEVLTEKEQMLFSFKQLEIDMALQVDTAASRIETSQRRLATTRNSISSAQATLDAEVKRLEQGVGVSFNILEAQREVAGAESRELAARADLNKALIDLWLSTGTLLDQFGIVLEEGNGVIGKMSK
jgi:outer membrane protein TolC